MIEVATAVTLSSSVGPVRRVGARAHHQCAWCLRLKHEDGLPHGKAWPLLPGYSHGVCLGCRAKLIG